MPEVESPGSMLQFRDTTTKHCSLRQLREVETSNNALWVRTAQRLSYSLQALSKRPTITIQAPEVDLSGLLNKAVPNISMPQLTMPQIQMPDLQVGKNLPYNILSTI